MKTKLSLPFLLLLLAWTACDDKETAAPPFLTVDSESVNFLADGKKEEVTIKTNVEDWTATVDPAASSWITVKKLESQLVGSSLTIEVSKNDNTDSRKGEIIVTANSVTKKIVVEQLGQAPAILVSSYKFPVDFLGGTIKFEVTSNIDYEIDIPKDATWIIQKENPSTRGVMIKQEYQFEVPLNRDAKERSAIITIRQQHQELKREVTVNQEGVKEYAATGVDDNLGDFKVKVSSGTASSFQPGCCGIEKSFNGSFNEPTYHSEFNGGPNVFPVTLDYNFENEERIDYLIYHPRIITNGQLQETEIWVSTEATPEFTKLMDYDFEGTKIQTKIIFDDPLIKPKSVRFVVKSGVNDDVAVMEMEFYRKNPDMFDPLTLFTDKTCSELKPGITLDDIDKVSSELYRNMAVYMYNDIYPREFRIDEFKAWPHPQDWARANKTATLSLLDNPTGMSVKPDEDLLVLVGDTQGYEITLKIQQLDTPGRNGYGYATTHSLVPGLNKLKQHTGGLAYVFYHTPDYKTAPPVKIHFVTGKVNGYFDSQKHEAKDWSKYLNAAVDSHFDVLGEHAHLTFPTQSFKNNAANNGAQLIDDYDKLVRLEKEFMGLMEYNRPTINRAYFHVDYADVYMYSTGYRTAYQYSTLPGILNLDRLRQDPWGPAHETGHSLQTRPGFKWQGMTEVSNNMMSQYVAMEFGTPFGHLGPGTYQGGFNMFMDKTPHWQQASKLMLKLIPFWQLQLYFSNVKGDKLHYAKFYEWVRTTPNRNQDKESGQMLLDFVEQMCEISGTNLSRFFQRWGFLVPYDDKVGDYGRFVQVTITQSMIDATMAKIEKYPEVTDMIEYIGEHNTDYFINKSSVQKGTATKSGDKITMTNWKNVVAYEVYESDKLVFIGVESSFNIENPVTENTKVYAIAYNGDKTEVTF